MITLSIDVDKIDKSRFYSVKTKEGMVRKYDLVLIETPDSKYDTDYMVVEGTSKAERQKGARGTILGNAKLWEPKGNARGATRTAGVKSQAEDW